MSAARTVSPVSSPAPVTSACAGSPAAPRPPAPCAPVARPGRGRSGGGAFLPAAAGSCRRHNAPPSRHVKGHRMDRRFVRPKKFDRNLIVIGAGSAGLVAALVAAKLGARITLVERDRMGGDCLNTGCVPSKALIHAA